MADHMAPTPRSTHIVRLIRPLVIILVLEALLFQWKFWLSSVGLINLPDGQEARFALSKVRIVAMLVVWVAYRLFRPSSRIWSTRLEDLGAKGRAGLIGIFIALCVSVCTFSQLSGQAAWLEQGAAYNEGIEAIQDGNQYNHLADALLSGSVSLDLPVPDLLKEMENPYDPAERARLNAERHDTVYWDYAYYNGQYYCYFGVVPCLLTFLPFKLITGMDLRTDIVVMLFSCLVMAAAAGLLINLKRTFFKDLSLGSFIVGFILLGLSNGVLEQAFLPRIYPIPILSALFFALTGIGFWLAAKRSFNQTRKRSCYLIIGSFCVALTLGCRPQFVLTALLAFPIFWDEIKRREFFSVRGLPNTLMVILPFIAIATPIGLYNYARFGSFADFGASYNLTGGDMTSYQFVPEKIAVQFLEYLFLPLQLIGTFPFFCMINDTQLAQDFPLLLTAEPFYAGFMFLTPATFALFAVASKRVRKTLSKRHLLPLFGVSLAIAAVNIVVASYVSGTNMRYFADFAWFILIVAVLTIWSIEEAVASRRTLAFIAFLAVVGLALYGWTFLGTARFGALYYECPTLYNALQAAVCSLLP